MQGGEFKFKLMIMRKLFLLLAVSTCLAGFAQNSIRGKVQDIQGQPIEYTTIRLLQNDSTLVCGTVSDSAGIYHIQCEGGNYLLYFSAIGYVSKCLNLLVDNQQIVMPDITLEGDNVLLNEVIVKGTQFIRQKDKTLIIPDKQQTKYAHTGYDLLSNLMIPGVDVDRQTGEVSTLQGAVTLYINGEKVGYREVQSLRPRDVEKIEYYNVPTGKYASDIASINYIVRAREDGGYVSLDAKQNIGYQDGDYNLSAKLSKKGINYSFWAGNNYKRYKEGGSEEQEKFIFDEGTLNRTQTYDGYTSKSNKQYMQFKVGQNNAKRNISAGFSIVRDQIPTNCINSKLDYAGILAQNSQSQEKSSSRSLQPSAYFYGSFNLPNKQQLETLISGSYTYNKYNRFYQEDEWSYITNVNEDLYKIEAMLKYNKAFKHNNALGVHAHHLQRVSSSAYSGSYNSWQHLWSGESLLWTIYTHQLSKRLNLNAKLGGSLMNYKLHDNELRREYSLRFSSMLAYTIGRTQQLVWATKIGNNTPMINYTNSVEQSVDQLIVKRGNPKLDNAKLYETDVMYGAQFGKLNMQLVAVFEYDNKVLYPIYFSEGNKMVNTFLSDIDLKAFMTQSSFSYRFSNNFRLKFTGGYLALYHPATIKTADDCFFGTLNLNYYYKNLSFNLYSDMSTSRMDYLLTYKKFPMKYGVFVGWSRKGWYAEAGVNNLFLTSTKYKEHGDFGVYQYYVRQSSPLYHPNGYIKLAYTFDFGKKTSHENTDVNMNINSAIMKAQ